jgi:hypothetical protein
LALHNYGVPTSAMEATAAALCDWNFFLEKKRRGQQCQALQPKKKFLRVHGGAPTLRRCLAALQWWRTRVRLILHLFQLQRADCEKKKKKKLAPKIFALSTQLWIEKKKNRAFYLVSRPDRNVRTDQEKKPI